MYFLYISRFPSHSGRRNLFSWWSPGLACPTSIPVPLIPATFTISSLPRHPPHPLRSCWPSCFPQTGRTAKTFAHLVIGNAFPSASHGWLFHFLQAFVSEKPRNHSGIQLVSKPLFPLIFLFHPFTTRHIVCESVHFSLTVLTCNSH